MEHYAGIDVSLESASLCVFIFEWGPNSVLIYSDVGDGDTPRS